MISTSGTGLKGHDEFNLAFTTFCCARHGQKLS